MGDGPHRHATPTRHSVPPRWVMLESRTVGRPGRVVACRSCGVRAAGRRSRREPPGWRSHTAHDAWLKARPSLSCRTPGRRSEHRPADAHHRRDDQPAASAPDRQKRAATASGRRFHALAAGNARCSAYSCWTAVSPTGVGVATRSLGVGDGAGSHGAPRSDSSRRLSGCSSTPRVRD